MPDQGDRAERKLALLIGTAHYSEDLELRELRAPARDVADLAKVLNDPSIGGFDVKELIDVGHAEMREEIEDFCAGSLPGDLVVVYLSCHGLLNNKDHLYFTATDTARKKIASTGVAAAWLNERLDDDCRAQRQLIILDCCFSGAFARRAKGPRKDVGLGGKLRPPEDRVRLSQDRGRIVYTASSAVEYSFESDHPSGEGVRSVFTRNLVYGLRTGEADLDQDGWITFDDLRRYLDEKVHDEEPRQTPQLWTNGLQGKWRIARSSRFRQAPQADDGSGDLRGPQPGLQSSRVKPRQRDRTRLRYAWMGIGLSLALISLTVAGWFFFADHGIPGASVRWSYPTRGVVDGSPVVADGTVYIGAESGILYALEATSGTPRWARPTGGAVYSRPAVADGTVYVGSQDGHLYALDADSGHQRWSYPTGPVYLSGPAVADGTVYVGSDDGTVYAIYAGTGDRRWSFSRDKSPIDSSPAISDGLVYIGSDDWDMYALNAANGNVQWTFKTGGPIDSGPTVVNGVVYFGSDDGDVYALAARTGHLLWSYPTGADVVSSPALAAGVVYFGSDNGDVYALASRTGHLLWSYATKGSVDSSPMVLGGIVYIGSYDGNVYALHSGNGTPYWIGATGPIGFSDPFISEDTAYVGTNNGYVYALKSGQ